MAGEVTVAKESRVNPINATTNNARRTAVDKIKLPGVGKDKTYNINGKEVVVGHGRGSSFPHIQPTVTVGIRQSDGSFKNRSFKYGYSFKKGYGENATYTEVGTALEKAKEFIRKKTT